VWNAGSFADRPDVHVAIIDVPSLSMRVIAAAAGEGGHAKPSADLRSGEAARDWGCEEEPRYSRHARGEELSAGSYSGSLNPGITNGRGYGAAARAKLNRRSPLERQLSRLADIRENVSQRAGC
jgi:hypothetical protein